MDVYGLGVGMAQRLIGSLTKPGEKDAWFLDVLPPCSPREFLS